MWNVAVGCASSRMCPRAGKNPEMSLSTNRRLLLFWFLTQALFVPETEKVKSELSLLFVSPSGGECPCPPWCVCTWQSTLCSAQATDGGESGESEVESCERKLTDQGRCQPKVVGSVCWYQPSARCQVPEVPTSQPRTLPAQGDSWSLESARCSKWAEPSSRSGENKVISGGTGIGQVGLATDAAFQAKYCDRKVQANKTVPTARWSKFVYNVVSNIWQLAYQSPPPR